jgi:HPt (histidine-containing phosphotransfer) domain-containing protein
MTVNVLPEQVRTYRAAGMNDYVGKPLNKEDFLRKLSEWLPEMRATEQPAALPELPVPIFDQQAFDSLRTLMGAQRVSEWIERFLQQLEATFPVAAAEIPPRDLLARNAHALVSHAALLGFLELARLCGELEEACVSGGDVDLPIGRVRAAARDAEDQAREISPYQ